MNSPKQEFLGQERNFFKTLPTAVKPVVSSQNVMNGMTEASGRSNGWVQPKFKVSRGTQVIAENLEKPAPAMSKSHDVATVDSPRSKSVGPPVPPKPFKKAQTQRSLNKPPLPPKPSVFQKPKLLPKPQPPPTLTTTSRCNQILTNSPMPRRPLFCGEKSSCSKPRKSSSLGRLEGRQYRGLLGEEDESLKPQLVYESGYISCSLESISQALARLSAENPPKAPPRRRRRSHPEPIYAVIDFSKKRNRRLALQQQTENKSEGCVSTPVDESSSIADSGNASKTLSDASSLTINTGLDSCDPSIGSQEDLESNLFSEVTSQTENESVNDIFAELTDKLSELGSDEMIISDEFLDGALSSPVPVKKKIEFFNTRTDSQQSFKFGAKKTRENRDQQQVALKSRNSGSINEASSDGECRGISSRSSPTASVVSLCSSDSSDSKSKRSFVQNPCDPDALSVSSLGDVDTSDSTNLASSAGDSESCNDARNDNNPSPSDQCEGRTGDAPLGNETLALEAGMSPDTEASSSGDKTLSGAPFHRPISRDDPRRKIQSRNASFGVGTLKPKLAIKDGIRRSSHEPSSGGNASELPNHSKSSTDCSTSNAMKESSPLDFLQGKERKAYMTAREIASSEKVFVECLGLVCDDFRQALKSASRGDQELIMPEGELNKILNYLPQLYNLNQDLLRDFESRVNNWMTNPKIADVIVRKGPFLKMFSAYVRDFQGQMTYLDECVQRYPKFGSIVKQFELSEKCKNLTLKHYMLKPVQRLPQYRLLLEVYLKHLTEGSPDYYDTLAALKIVSDVADHANNSMKIEDNFHRLLRLQSRLSECEIIKPGRTIIKEGELLKLSRKSLQLRYFILLNDSLLYTSFTGSPSSSSGLKLHHELPLDDMEIRESPLAGAKEDAYEFSVISTERSFTLVATSEKHRGEWMDTLQNAITQWNSNKLSFRACARKRECKLGEQAPIWIPDGRVTMCQLCTTTFSLTFRRHHCRACGRVVCRNCSSHQAPLKYLKGRPARVCDKCFYTITGESSFLDKTLQRSSRKSIVDLAIGTSSISIPAAMIADAFDEDKVVCKESSSEKDGTKQKNRPRNVSPRLLHANDSESQISGFLSRRTKRGWKRSWFVLKDLVLYVYKAPEDVLALETVPVLGYQVQVPEKGSSETQQNIFQLHHQNTNIVFQADDPSATKRWIDALVQATSGKN